MTSPQKNRAKLRMFFWLVWVFNLAEYIAFGYAALHEHKNTKSSGTASGLVIFLALFFFFFPLLVASMGQILLIRYYPDRELRAFGRISVISLCIIQILVSIFMSAGGLEGLLVELPHGANELRKGVFLLPAYLMYISILTAAIWNLAAAIVVWRMIWAIKRNFKKGLEEVFETV